MPLASYRRRGPGGMPTKTRLDPIAGGTNPPAEPDGAQGAGPRHSSWSPRAGAPLPGDFTGFIDSLSALAEHLREREAFEADVRRGWARMSVWCALFVPLGLLSAWISGGIMAVGSR